MAEPDLTSIEAEEKELVFAHFNEDDAYRLGTIIRDLASGRDQGIVVDVTLAGRQLFFAATPGSAKTNADWVRRKSATAMRFGRPTLALRLKFQAEGKTLQQAAALEPMDFAWDGGCFPILIEGTGAVGTVTVSGLPDVEDHALAVEGLRRLKAGR